MTTPVTAGWITMNLVTGKTEPIIAFDEGQAITPLRTINSQWDVIIDPYHTVYDFKMVKLSTVTELIYKVFKIHAPWENPQTIPQSQSQPQPQPQPVQVRKRVIGNRVPPEWPKNKESAVVLYLRRFFENKENASRYATNAQKEHLAVPYSKILGALRQSVLFNREENGTTCDGLEAANRFLKTLQQYNKITILDSLVINNKIICNSKCLVVTNLAWLKGFTVQSRR